MDGNPNTAGDPTWLPFTNTPPYPDYTSGANSVTAAMMRTLSLYFGNDNMRIRVLTANPLAIKKSRTYNSFSAVAAQVVTVRVYHGIHFRFADQELHGGRTSGRVCPRSRLAAGSELTMFE